jgi:AraC family transcriptional regulator
MLNAFERMNEVVRYVEERLASEIDYDRAAEIACCSKQQVQRLFSYLTGNTLTEYIKRRRLTVCAFELQQQPRTKVMDIAQRYGYDSHASFARAFRDYHGISPTTARDKSAVFHICPKLTFQIQQFPQERGDTRMAVLGKIEFTALPATRMIGIKTINGGGENPVPALWETCFRENAFAGLDRRKAVMPYWVGWMGEYQPESGTFTYLAGQLMPEGTEVPEGFDYRDLPSCLLANGFINGDFENGDVFAHSHELTLGGIAANGYEPAYAYGWSAEAYAYDLSFEATEGTLNYFCPCQQKQA